MSLVYTFAQIVANIKEEGRVDRSNDFDDLIKNMINEVLVKHTRNKQYPELYVTQHPLTIASDGQEEYTLPDGFTRMSNVRWSTDGTTFRWLKKNNQFALPFTQGVPQWWYRAGNSLFIYPATSVLSASNVLQIDYYSLPTLLVDDADILNPPDLYPVILMECLSRIRRMHDDIPADQQYQGDAQRAMTTQQDDPT